MRTIISQLFFFLYIITIKTSGFLQVFIKIFLKRLSTSLTALFYKLPYIPKGLFSQSIFMKKGYSAKDSSEFLLHDIPFLLKVLCKSYSFILFNTRSATQRIPSGVRWTPSDVISCILSILMPQRYRSITGMPLLRAIFSICLE